MLEMSSGSVAEQLATTTSKTAAVGDEPVGEDTTIITSKTADCCRCCKEISKRSCNNGQHKQEYQIDDPSRQGRFTSS